MVFIILYVNNATTRITKRCRQRKQIRGAAALAAEGGRGRGVIAAISHSRDLYRRGRPAEVKFSN